jgi:hypothetical protein
LKPRTVALSALMLCVSCGPGASPDRAAAPLAIGPAAAPRPAATARPDLPRAPDDLALLVRVNDAEQLVHDAASILPKSAASFLAELDPAQAVVLLFGRKLGALVDLAQPIDVASVGKAQASFVVSMAVKADAESRLGEGLVLRDDGGLVHIAKPDEPAMEAGRMTACAFAPAAGRATTRLVCASDEVSLASTAAYLARSVAAEPLDVDARVTLPGKLLREKRESTAKALGDAASARLGAELVDGFLDEIDRVDADVRFVSPSVEIGLDLRLLGRSSMLSRVLVPRSVPSPPPRAFYRLPADAVVALHLTGAVGDDIAPLRKAITENIEGTLVQDGYAPEKTRALRERFETLLLTGGPIVIGAGLVGGRDGVDQALAAHAAQSSTATEARARAALVPWVMIEVDEPAAKWTQGLRDVVLRVAQAEKTRTPGSRSSTPRDPDGDHVDVKIGALDPKLKLPSDALHLEVLITPRTKGARPPRRGHLFVVPKGASTWLGYSEDIAAIGARLRLATDDATEAGTLGKSAEATGLRARPAVGAGVVEIGGLAYLGAKTSTTYELRALATAAARAAGRGAHTNESVGWTMTADATPGSVHVAVHTRITRQTIVDLMHALEL